MKIIGQTDGGYLIEATALELEQIAGYDAVNATTRVGLSASTMSDRL